MAFGAAILIVLLLALWLAIIAVRTLRRRRIGVGLFCGCSGLVLAVFAVCALLAAINLRTYQRLTEEQPVGVIEFHQTGPQAFNGQLNYASGGQEAFALQGDEWQIDARVLKWQAFATVIGFDTAYRLDRIGGRYTRIEDERGRPRTVYALGEVRGPDVWALVKRYHSMLPFVDALYGSATYLPMVDGARFDIRISPSGLLARPLNQAARDSISSWH